MNRNVVFGKQKKIRVFCFGILIISTPKTKNLLQSKIGYAII